MSRRQTPEFYGPRLISATCRHSVVGLSLFDWRGCTTLCRARKCSEKRLSCRIDQLYDLSIRFISPALRQTSV